MYSGVTGVEVCYKAANDYTPMSPIKHCPVEVLMKMLSSLTEWWIIG
jgi:hypothetical protein